MFKQQSHNMKKNYLLACSSAVIYPTLSGTRLGKGIELAEMGLSIFQVNDLEQQLKWM